MGDDQSHLESIDENGIKTIIEVKTNEKGQKVKITKKIRMIKAITKHNRAVEEIKKWKKFGDCAGMASSRESGVTSVGDELTLTLSGSQPKEDHKAASTVPANIVCRTCNKTGDHYTLKCPFKQLAERGGLTQESLNAATEDNSTPTNKYVIPSLRNSAGGRATVDDESFGRRLGEEATVRVTNLSEDTKESDLQELFRPFGAISRVYLAKDKITNLSRGFAFINFVRQEDAARAIEKLSGFGYDHLILHLEWAKPSK